MIYYARGRHKRLINRHLPRRRGGVLRRVGGARKSWAAGAGGGIRLADSALGRRRVSVLRCDCDSLAQKRGIGIENVELRMENGGGGAASANVEWRMQW